MDETRLLPHVERESLDEVISNIKEHGQKYQELIMPRIYTENIILVPRDLVRSRGFMPLSLAVYELLAISLPAGKRLPTVSEETFRSLSENCPGASLGVAWIGIDRNEMVNDFLYWLENNGYSEGCSYGSMVYAALRLQASKNEKVRRARLN